MSLALKSSMSAEHACWTIRLITGRSDQGVCAGTQEVSGNDLGDTRCWRCPAANGRRPPTAEEFAEGSPLPQHVEDLVSNSSGNLQLRGTSPFLELEYDLP